MFGRDRRLRLIVVIAAATVAGATVAACSDGPSDPPGAATPTASATRTHPTTALATELATELATAPATAPAGEAATQPSPGAPASTPATRQSTSIGSPVVTAGGLPAPQSCPGCWRPPLRLSWDLMLSKVPKPPYRTVGMIEIDGFDATAADAAALHAAGAKVVCYFSGGSYEDWRSDAGQFPAAVLGRPLDGWPGERWLDIRDIQRPDSTLARIMNARLDMCRAKGFDAVDFDNVDGYTNGTGFPLTAKDQLAYNVFLANGARARGMSAVLKNDVSQLQELLPYFDLAVNEQCNQYNECGRYRPFIAAGKPVFNAEYGSSTAFCAADNAANINGLRLSRALDGSVHEPCR